jgi:chorismate mutase
MMRGIRGATTVERNEANEIIARSVELLEDMVKQNGFLPEDISSVFFTVTKDITDAFPAKSLRQMDGWTYVPVMCMTEIPVPGSLPLCIRVMVTVNTEKGQKEISHVYHNEAKQLRPDLKS